MNRSLALVAVVLFVCPVSTRAHPPEFQEKVLLDLQEAIRLVLGKSPDLALSESQAIRASAAVRETESLNLPQVMTGTGLAYNNGFPLSIEGSAPSIVQVAVSQSLFSKKNKNLILERKEEKNAREVGAAHVKNEIVARTALVYFDLHHSRKIESIQRKRLELFRREEQLSRTLLQAGRVRPIDVTKATASTAGAQHRVLLAREMVQLAETEMKQLLGYENRRIATLEPQMDSPLLNYPPEELYKNALEIHPQLKEAEARLRAREYHVEAEKGEAWPRVHIIGEYALFSRANNYDKFFNQFTRHNGLIGLSIQVPVFDGFRRKSRIAQSRQEVDEARHQRDRLRLQLKLGVSRSASEMRIARDSVKLARMQAKVASEDFKVHEALLEKGRISEETLDTARGQLHQREVEFLNAQASFWKAKIELLRLTGNLAEMF